jgi:hypothetical protein
MSFKTIYCSCCETKVQAKLTMGDKIYNNSKFKDIPFWKCQTCSNFVSQRKEKTKTGENILVIPTPELRKARMEILKLLTT